MKLRLSLLLGSILCVTAAYAETEIIQVSVAMNELPEELKQALQEEIAADIKKYEAVEGVTCAMEEAEKGCCNSSSCCNKPCGGGCCKEVDVEEQMVDQDAEKCGCGAKPKPKQ